jgi:CDP-diacylglycerol--glycerol-3-phosphate 3-phosphatidyltransferase
LFDKRCRPGMERGLKPIGTTLRDAGVSADQLTVTGLVISALAAAAVGRGWLILGAVLLAASAIPDVLDGAVAKASGTASPRGAFFDSVVDRVSDSLVLGGVAWYLAGAEGAHAAVLPLAVLAASNLVSYERARAESLGFSAKGGLMERAERMILVGAGLLFSAVLVPILWLMLVLTLVTAGHRFAMVWRQASAPSRVAADRGRGRWRGWRPAEGFEFRRAGERRRLRAREGGDGAAGAGRARPPRGRLGERPRRRPRAQ